ncbi:MAG: DNA-processing protein DprA, partial [Paracoccaceae bacterium]
MAKDLIPSPTPLTPPHHEEERLNRLRLLRSRRVGPATFFRLLREYGDAGAALSALPEVARAAGVKDYQPCPENVALAELGAGKLAGARLISSDEAAYPALLREISDAPPMIWVVGDTGLLSRPMVALVGARNASSLGTRMARRLAAGLSEAGFVVVSGLARGVDTAAHIAAPKSTIAVMAGGVDVVYPAENASLAQEISNDGLCLSEQPMGQRPQARHFPRRNRIISGLCRGIVVVEAAARSGSLITARCAADQGREVLAVPGHPFDGRASGCNMLLRDGATLVRSVDDVLCILTDAPEPRAPEAPTPEAPTPEAPTPEAPTTKPRITEVPAGMPEGRRDIKRLHADILARLGPSPLAEDQLIRDLNIPAAEVAPALINLELEGKINRAPGGLLNLTCAGGADPDPTP